MRGYSTLPACWDLVPQHDDFMTGGHSFTLLMSSLPAKLIYSMQTLSSSHVFFEVHLEGVIVPRQWAVLETSSQDHDVMADLGPESPPLPCLYSSDLDRSGYPFLNEAHRVEIHLHAFIVVRLREPWLISVSDLGCMITNPMELAPAECDYCGNEIFANDKFGHCITCMLCLCDMCLWWCGICGQTGCQDHAPHPSCYPRVHFLTYSHLIDSVEDCFGHPRLTN